jgi:hypothetical protein
MGSSRQFVALLHKNVLLQTRSRKTLFGLGGWGALAAQVCIVHVVRALNALAVACNT